MAGRMPVETMKLRLPAGSGSRSNPSAEPPAQIDVIVKTVDRYMIEVVVFDRSFDTGISPTPFWISKDNILAIHELIK
jgi:hypothetical protein